MTKDNRTSRALSEIEALSYYGVENADTKIVAIAEKYKRMEEALRLLSGPLPIPISPSEIAEEALSFDPLSHD